jgi:hypothetical protein
LKYAFAVKFIRGQFQQICYFQRMLKLRYSVKEIEDRAADALQGLLKQIPKLKLKTLKTQKTGADILARVNALGQQHLLVGEVKSNGQPRYVRDAIYQLRSYIAQLGEPATPVLIAPYLSPASRELCTQNGVSFLDFEGNTRIVFGTVFIERVCSSKPEPERREFKSLFRPKSAQVLRILLRNPKQVWKVTDLAEAAEVSLGHVSNVRTALLEREWASIVPEGLLLTAPGALLDAWKSSYTPLVEQELRFYTILHGSSFENSVREMFRTPPPKIAVALSSFSAAHWIAPFARTGTQYLYAEHGALEHIKSQLRLSSSLRGENVVISLPKDNGIFLDVYEPVPGIRCTSPVQTYLDLSVSGERGAEAAEHLRHTRLTWKS